jgi:pimeloyl-ACP methyl ester carboxylesterase
MRGIAEPLLENANKAIGVVETIREYVTGGSTYTDKAYAQITRDLLRNPLVPGETVVLVAHSGGGAIVSNLAPRLETNDGVNVSTVVTLGSPIVNRDAVTRVANIIEVRDIQDYVGFPVIRSEESRNSLVPGILQIPTNPFAVPSFFIAEYINRNQTPRESSFVTESRHDSPHSSYWTSNTVFDIIKPAFGLK